MHISNLALQERDAASQIHGYTDLSTVRAVGSTVFTHGDGIHVIDERGKRYIEGVSGMWCTNLGFREPELVEAAVRQLEKLPYYYNVAMRATEPSVELADKLRQIVPVDDARIYFQVSGSEANETYVKFMRYYNNARGKVSKKKLISRINSYHGSSLAASSMTGIARFHEDFDLPLPGFLHTREGNPYREKLSGETDTDFAARMASELDDLITKEGAETVAAFASEPVLGGGGVVLPANGYFDQITRVLRKHDVMFHADEIITGFGRTGNMFASDTYSIRPDMMAMAKGMSSAYQPISAVAVSGAIYDGLEKGCDAHKFFAHASTYSAHPVAAAVALKTIEIIEKRQIIAHVREVSATFAERVARFTGRDLVLIGRSVGLIGGIEFAPKPLSSSRFRQPGEFAKLVANHALHRGLIVRVMGDVIGLSPPLIITHPQVEEMFDILDAAYEAALAEAGPDMRVAA